MKSFLVSLLWLCLLGLFIWFIWDHLPTWGQWTMLGIFMGSVFLNVWIFFTTILKVLFSHFSTLFNVLFSFFVTAILGWFGWNIFFTTHSSSLAIVDPLSEAMNVITTSSSEINGNVSNTDQNQSATLTFTIPSSSEEPANTTGTKEEILSILKNNTEIGPEEKKYWEQSLNSLTPQQLGELKSILQVDRTGSEIAVVTATPNPQVISSPNHTEDTIASSVMPTTSVVTLGNNDIMSSQTIATTSATPTFSYTNDSKDNWKQPVIISAESSQTPSPSTTGKEKIPTLISSGIDDTKFIIPMKKINAQMVFPLEYQIASVVWTDPIDATDEVSFAVKTNTGLRAFVTVSVKKTGDKVDQYAWQFTTPLVNANRFIISDSTPTSTTYTSFFGGMLWDIHVSLPFSEKPSSENFYSILLPMVFEAKK